MLKSNYRVYLAGPLFSKAERNYNSSLASRLESEGFHVFLPQRDGAEYSKPDYLQLPKEERRSEIFRRDREEIYHSDIFLFVLDGRVPDEGACVELGMAYTYKSFCSSSMILVGLHTDVRASFIGSKLNPMLHVPLDVRFEDEDDLVGFLLASYGKTPEEGSWS